MTRKLIATVGLALLAAGCGDSDRAAESAAVATPCPTADENGVVQIQEGLTAKVLKNGYGRAAMSMDYADVNAKLWVYDPNAEGGRGVEIWATEDGEPFQFQIDVGDRIAGWDLGIKCMLLGEKRELVIAPELGYGARGRPPVPPNATLLYELELIALQAPE